MPIQTIPLVGPLTTRPGKFLTSSVNYDQRYINAIFESIPNQLSNESSLYLYKRPGAFAVSTPATGNIGTASFRGAIGLVTAFGATNSTIYLGDVSTSSCGTITGICYYISEGYIAGKLTAFITSNDGTGWYMTGASGTFTADTHSNTTLDNIASTSNLNVGQKLSGTNIASGARIASIDSATSLTMTLAATGTTAGVTVSYDGVAKIINPNFPSFIKGPFAVVDGFAVAIDSTNRRIYNSDVNSPSSWSSSSYLTFDEIGDSPNVCFRHAGYLCVSGAFSTCFYQNAGNAFGSIFTINKSLTKNIGIYGGALKAIAFCGDGIYAVGAGRNSPVSIWSMFGGEVKNIESSVLSRQINNGLGFAPLISAFSLNGINRVLVSQGASPKMTFLITPGQPETEQQFLNTTCTVIASGGQPYSQGAAPTDAQAIYLVDNDGTSGSIFRLRSTTFQDNAGTLQLTAQTQPFALNKGRPFKIKRVGLIADNQSAGSTTLKTSADDYANFVTRGTFDLTLNKKEIWRCGRYDNAVAFQLTDSGNNAWRGQAIEVDWEPCS